MTDFRFYLPIDIRYGDLDPQGHTNNSRMLTFFENARMFYFTHLGLWDGASFMDLGLIVADVHVVYLAPVWMGQKVRVGMRVSRIGTKSLTTEYELQDETNGAVLARGEIIMVSFDYHTHTSIPVSAHWRETISAFEGLPL